MPHALSLPELVWALFREAREDHPEESRPALLKLVHRTHFVLKNTRVAKEIISLPRMRRVVDAFENGISEDAARRARRCPIDEHEEFIREDLAAQPTM